MKNFIKISVGALGMVAVVSSCVPSITQRVANSTVPDGYGDSQDTTNIAAMDWRDYFDDPYLEALIDSALMNNQELNIFLQEMQMVRNEAMAQKGEYLPFVDLGVGAGAEKVGRYTRPGAVEANTEIMDGKEFPEPLGDFLIGATASWEVDIWHKLRNARQATLTRYLGTVEGQNFLVTNLIAEIASSYYELLALDNQLAILQQNIKLQSDALEIVKLQKSAARVSELAVRRFEAQVLGTRSLQFDIQQQIVEVENRINFLVGRFPQAVPRQGGDFEAIPIREVLAGVPAQLLENRPDVRQAELELEATKLDVQVAKANFYPSLGLSAGLGMQAFNPKLLVTSPESLMFGLAGDLAAPLVNRNAIKAMYYNANAKQIQAVYDYEQTLLKAYIEVINQLANLNNLQSGYDLKSRQVQALTESIEISNNLFRSARADYMEVLLTQREALESRFELIETKKEQLIAQVQLYRALGGGWQ